MYIITKLIVIDPVSSLGCIGVGTVIHTLLQSFVTSTISDLETYFVFQFSIC
jgi:hypothetical protein